MILYALLHRGFAVADLQYLDFPLIFGYLLTAQELEQDNGEAQSEENRRAMLLDAADYVEEYRRQGLISEEEYQAFLQDWRDMDAAGTDR